MLRDESDREHLTFTLPFTVAGVGEWSMKMTILYRVTCLGAALSLSLIAGYAEPAPATNNGTELAKVRAQQRALRRLATEPGAEVDRELSHQLDELDAGRLPLVLWLDVLEAAGQRADPALKSRLAERTRVMAASTDPLRQWRECLEGGSAAEGRAIFYEEKKAGCNRCHRIGKEGGEIGPDLTTVAQRAQRISILESIIDPNAYIVVGFKHLLVKLKDGTEVSGLVNAESGETMKLISVTDGKATTIRTSEIETETALPSPMPPGLGTTLGKRAIRDLVEFLAKQE